MGKTFEDRFWEKVEKTETCWIWCSARQGGRYGVFWVGRGKSEFAHRIAWILTNKRSIPHGMLIRHSCDNVACVNPDHLLLGTHQDNRNDCVSKKRHSFGAMNKGGGKLTDNKVKIILSLNGDNPSRLASKLFGIHIKTVRRIRARKLWKHVTID